MKKRAEVYLSSSKVPQACFARKRVCFVIKGKDYKKINKRSRATVFCLVATDDGLNDE